LFVIPAKLVLDQIGERESRGVLTMREYYVFILIKINSIFVLKIFSPNNVMNKQKQITTTN